MEAPDNGAGQRVVIYVRLSYASREGQAEATLDRQEADCRARAVREGWEVVGVYQDVDSAYSGKHRPGYEAMVEAANAGEFDIVLCWRTDRLYRRVQQLLDITTGLAAWVRIETVNSGEIDLTTADGRLRAGMLAQIAEHESAVKAERVAARIEQRATKELRHSSGGRRSYGWMPADPNPLHPDRPRPGGVPGYVVHEPEAEYLREAYERVARGDSMISVVRWLNSEHQVGPTGQPFKQNTLRSTLLSPRHAGLVSHRGQLVGEAADGQRVVTVETWYSVRTRIQDPDKDHRSRARTLLAGKCRCGRCGAIMNASTKDNGPRGQRVQIFRCRGCSLSRRRFHVEPLVVTAVTDYLGRHAEDILSVVPVKDGGAAQDLRDIDAQLDALGKMIGDGTIDARAYQKATNGLYERREQVEARMLSEQGKPVLSALYGKGFQPEAWEALIDSDLPRARALINELIETVVVNPSSVAGRPLPDDIKIVWRP